MLYIRTFVSMIISLYSVRIVLDSLGVIDYGIHNVVSGFISLFSFVTGSLSVTISRFMSIEIGQGNKDKLTAVYSTSIWIMTAIAIFFILATEAFGVWFVNSKMVIPPDRLYAANWVLQFAALTLALSLISVPFDALIVSHEKMGAFAYIGILSSLLKLAAAFAVSHSTTDRLVLYSILLFVQAAVIRCCYGTYCSHNFKDVKCNKKTDRPLIKKILSMSGWDLWGSSSFVIKNYGVNIILNIFFGAPVNAARGIAMQVNSAVTQFSGGFLTAFRPQITKEYAQGNRERLWTMVDTGTKFATFLLLLISMPVMLECNYIMTLWLGSVPEHTCNFITLTILLSISEGTLIYTQNTALLAHGKIKTAQLITGVIQLSNIPLAYMLLANGMPPESTIILAIAIAQICCFIRSKILTNLTGYSTARFFKRVYLRLLAVGIISAIPVIYIKDLMDEGMCRLVTISVVSFIWTGLTIYTIGCTCNERYFIIDKIKNIYNRRANR